jgi:hypothetical protein
LILCLHSDHFYDSGRFGREGSWLNEQGHFILEGILVGTVTTIMPGHFAKIITFVVFLLVMRSSGHCQESSGLNMGDLFGTDEEPTDYTPPPRQLHVPDSLSDVPVELGVSETQELSGWARWLVLKNLPPQYINNRKWDQKKDVFAGIDMRWEDGKIKTHRKYKQVKHGSWTRYVIDFVDPQNALVVEVKRVDFTKKGKIGIEIRVESPLRLFAQLKQYQRNFQWYSVSVEAEAIVEMTVDCQIAVHVNGAKFPPDVLFHPIVNQAKVQLKHFEVNRISRLKGEPAEFLGKQMRTVLDEKLAEYDTKLVEKMNKEITKQKDKLRLSLSDWLTKSVSKQTQVD